MSLLRRSASVALATVALTIGLAAPSSAADPVEEAKVAIGAGDGAEAAEIVAENGFATQPDVLAELIYGGGVIAVRDGLFDEFTYAVADAFVDGGVDFATAQLAFVDAALLVASNAANDPQILQEIGPGGVAILRTQLAYLGLDALVPALPLNVLQVLPILPLPLQPF